MTISKVQSLLTGKQQADEETEKEPISRQFVNKTRQASESVQYRHLFFYQLRLCPLSWNEIDLFAKYKSAIIYIWLLWFKSANSNPPIKFDLK